MSLGLIECPFLCITTLLCDHALKTAAVRLLGIETTGAERLQIRLEGMIGAGTSALGATTDRARQLGTEVTTRTIARPDIQLEPLLHFPNVDNPLLAGAGSISSDQ